MKKVKKISTIPIRKHESDTGFDIKALERFSIEPKGMQLIPTGLAFAIPKGFYGQIMPRSSMALAGLTTIGGVIDSGYNREVFILVVNQGLMTIMVDKGDHYVQILFIPIWTGELKEVTELPETAHGQKGFGSTGVNAASSTQEEDHGNYLSRKTQQIDYKIRELLTREQKSIIKNLMRRYEDVLATDFEEIKGAHLHFYYDIILKSGARPIKKRAYRTLYVYYQWSKEEIARINRAEIV